MPSKTDNQVDAIYEESKAILEERSRMARRHKELIDKNGFTMRIYIATGGDHRNVH